jgi:hypothetical protein
LGVSLVSPAQRQFDVFLRQSAIRIARLRASAGFRRFAAYHNPLQFQCVSGGKPGPVRLFYYVMVDRKIRYSFMRRAQQLKNSRKNKTVKILHIATCAMLAAGPYAAAPAQNGAPGTTVAPRNVLSCPAL